VPFLAAQQNNNMVRINGETFTMGSLANEVGRDSDEIQRQIGMELMQQDHKQIQEVRLLVSAAFVAVGVGTFRLSTLVLPFGTATFPTSGTPISASGWCAPE